MQTHLEYRGDTTPDPTDEDIARALAGPRDDDWYLTLRRGEEDSMEVMIDAGELWMECDDGGKFLQARSYVDEEAVGSMLRDYRDGGNRWRDLAAWAEPRRRSTPPPKAVLAFGVSAGLLFVALGITGIATGNGGWIGVAFALVLPAIIVIAVMVKVAEVKRAARWTQVGGKIVSSGMVTETRHDKEVAVPRVEYEYTVGFHRFRGKRVSLAELMSPAQSKAMLSRYPVGTSVPVFVDPSDPTRSVLERDLPRFFGAIWAFAAALTVLIAGAAYWFLLR